MAMDADIVRTDIYLEFFTVFGALGIPERRIMAKKLLKNHLTSLGVEIFQGFSGIFNHFLPLLSLQESQMLPKWSKILNKY